MAATFWPRCHGRPSLSLVNLYYKHILLFFILFTRNGNRIFHTSTQIQDRTLFVIRMSRAKRSGGNLCLGHQKLHDSRSCELCIHQRRHNGLCGVAKPLKVTEWPTSESLRGPHEGFRESFSFSLSLLPSPRCRKSCGFRGSGQGEAGGWPPPPPDHHLTAAHPSNTHTLALSLLEI